MLILVGLVESGLARHEIDLLVPIQNQWRTQARESRREAVRAEILCLGDSLVAQGVIPSILEERLGRRTYNLGVGGGQFPASYFFLRRALESGAKPQALVIDCMPLQLTIPARERSSLWASFVEPREAIELAWWARDAEFLGEIGLSRLVPSIRSRLEIRQVVLDALNGSPLLNRETNLAGRRNLKLNQGALVVPHWGAFQIDPRHQRWVYPRAIEPNRLNGHYMERFLELAESRQIPVFWLLTPICPTIQSKAEATGTHDVHVRFIQDVQARHPSITVIDARGAGYPEAVFADSIHLDPPGAAVFTTDLAQAIASRLDGKSPEPAWVKLPPYQDRPITFRHEDLMQSRKAITATIRR
jgi:hypothetical protein